MQNEIHLIDATLRVLEANGVRAAGAAPSAPKRKGIPSMRSHITQSTSSRSAQSSRVECSASARSTSVAAMNPLHLLSLSLSSPAGSSFFSTISAQRFCLIRSKEGAKNLLKTAPVESSDSSSYCYS